MQVQAFVAAAVVERFDVSVQPGLAGGDVVHSDPVVAVFLQRLAHQFRSVVGADDFRQSAAGHDAVDRGDQVGPVMERS